MTEVDMFEDSLSYFLPKAGLDDKVLGSEKVNY